HVNRALAAAGLGRRDHRLDNRPFGASQITRITKTAAVSSNAMFRLPHRVLPRESSANTESQPIHRTQQLPGSALRLRRVRRSKETSSLRFAFPDRSTPAIKLICHWIIGTMVEAIIRRWCRHVGGDSFITPR